MPFVGSAKQQDIIEKDRTIARLTATELILDMQKGVISSERVVEAFSRRARSIGSLKMQAVTQEFYDEAIAAASEIDRLREATSKGKGDAGSGRDARVLEGIPVSIKDSIYMKGAVRAAWSTLRLVVFRRAGVSAFECLASRRA